MKKKVSSLFLLMKVVFTRYPTDSRLSPKRSTVFWFEELGSQGKNKYYRALLGTTLFTIGLLNININSDIFYAWVTQVLVPALLKNSVIMMNNAIFHKKQSIQQVIIYAEHMVEYLPTYSPDLNPIEHKWAQAKSKRERAVATQIFYSYYTWCN